jgi:putative ABC transport system substrate-binding protein
MQFDQLKRRAFITLLGGAAVGPLAASAQQAGRIYRLGFLIPAGRQAPAVLALFDELRSNGFIEGQNLTVITEGFEAIDDRLAERAAALVKAAPDAIVAGPELPLRALQAVTRTIPLIGMTEDMVAAGLVASLARPGGNITGISLLSLELDGKRGEILIEAVPGAHRIAAMADSNVTPTSHIQALRQAARSRGVEFSVFGVSGSEEIIPAIDAAKASGAEALNFLATPLFSVPGTRNNGIVMKRIAAVRLPAIFQWPETAEAGALAGYGPRFTDVYRQRARMVVKILRGANPADIPVEQPTRFELVVNLRAAKEIDHEIPAALVLRADKVIE